MHALLASVDTAKVAYLIACILFFIALAALAFGLWQSITP